MTPAALSALGKGDLKNFIAASTPGGIEAQEKAGQIEQSFLGTLPVDGTSECRPAWEALGFVFGEPADEIFVNVKFPDGWRKRATDHSMHSDLLDDKGRIRASIFYKAAFYDRRAHVSLSRRFAVSGYGDAPEPGFYQVSITDSGAITKVLGTWKPSDYAAHDKLEAEAKDWLHENYPDWNNVGAYWS